MNQDINSVWKEFEENGISHSATHYLFSIQELKQKNGYARMTDIAKKLKITPGSCSIGIKSLVKKGLLIEDENKFLKLSKKAEKIIEEILYARDILIKFLTHIGIPEEIATINACKIEHLIDTKVIKKINAFINEF